MFHLTVQEGASKGATWSLEDGVHRVGRSAECEVAIAGDSAVSRRQCELLCREGVLSIRQLSERSATLLNGVAVTESALKPGDTLTVGFTTLLVSHTDGGAPRPEYDPHLETQSLRESDAIYLGGQRGGQELSHRPNSTQDLAELFQLAHEFSQAPSVAGLEEAAFRQIDERFGPQRCWLARSEPSSGELSYSDRSSPREDTLFAGIEGLMAKAMDNNEGALVPRSISVEARPELMTTLVSPLSLGGEAFGALALLSQSPGPVYGEMDLQFLVALCRALAPCILTRERAEELVLENERLRMIQQDAGHLLGTSRAMSHVRSQIGQAARSPLSVLIQGESGTGKEIAAHMVHSKSDSGEGPCVAVNCAAIPADMLESELFGYEKGAFTGAAARRIGLVEEAHGGTLFLDEIGDLSSENQARVLRVLESGSFRRLGGNEEIQVSFRTVAATNKDIAEMVRSGDFREDLYHRINAFEISMPPLRDHPSDIPVLAAHFLNQAIVDGQRPLKGIASEAMEQLRKSPWSGNARELKNTIARAAATAKGSLLEAADLVPPRIQGTAKSSVPMIRLDEAEKRHIAGVLSEHPGDVDQAAKVLGIARSTLYKKIKKFGIQL